MPHRKIGYAISDRMTVLGDYSHERELDRGVEYVVMQYLERILSAYEITGRIIGLAVLLIGAGGRRKLAELLFGSGVGEERNNRVFREMMSTVCSPDAFTGSILAGIGSGEIAVEREAIASHLKLLVAEQMREVPEQQISGFMARVGEAGSVFNLTCPETNVLMFLFCLYYSRIEPLYCFENNITIPEFYTLVSVATGCTLAEVKCALRSDGTLLKTRIITELSLNRFSDFVVLADGIVEYLAGLCDHGLLQQFLFPDDGAVFNLASFTSVTKTRAMLLRDLLASTKASNVLLYGRAGTGKTEFARSVIASAGKRACFLHYGYHNEQQTVDPAQRMIALCAAVNAVPADEGVIIVDEADSLLNTMNVFFSVEKSVEKGRLNAFMDGPRAHIVWISNNVEMVEESTMRRFSYSLYFREYTPHERRVFWKNILRQHRLRRFVPEKLIGELSTDFKVSAGGIAEAVRAAESVLEFCKPTGKLVASLLREVLERHEDLIRGSFQEERAKPLHFLNERYDVSALNTDVDTMLVRRAVNEFASRIVKQSPPDDSNINLLFWGQPGTGKTEFVKFLARESGLKLIVKRCSDLESKWVGDTEKNIAAAFRQAEAERAILFIDEADSFFTSREIAERSWEVSRTNEFLTWMENHRGMLICCTNLLPSMDRAAMRRFHWKIEFRPLNDGAKAGLFEKYFCRNGQRLDDADARRVASIADLVPGDIRAVWQRYSRLTGGSLPLDSIIGELVKEVSYRRGKMHRKVGFY